MIRWIFSVLAVLTCLHPLLAQQEAVAPDVSTAIVPVVGSILGLHGLTWKTDVELVNETGRLVTVALLLPTAADEPFVMTDIPARGRLHFTDVIGEAFAMEEALSPLLIRTFAKRSVTVRAVAYGVRDGERLTSHPVAVSYAGQYQPHRMLQGLSFSESFRTNIGLVNLSESDVHFTLGLERIPGRLLAVARMKLQPRSMSHLSVQTLFPLITSGDDFQVIVETSSHDTDTYVYASVIENATHTARFISPNVSARNLSQ